MKIFPILIVAALAVSSAQPAYAEPEMPSEEISEDRDAQPIRPPRPSFPALAIRVGMPGRCDVRFDVDVRGYPINIRPFCTHTVFCESASSAMADVVFKPKIVNGSQMPRFNVVYPLEYRIGNDEAEQERRLSMLDGKPPKPCSGGAIS